MHEHLYLFLYIFGFIMTRGMFLVVKAKEDTNRVGKNPFRYTVLGAWPSLRVLSMQSLISIMVLPICRVVQNCLRYSKGGGAKKFGVQKGGGQNFYVGKGGQKLFRYPNVRPNFFGSPKGWVRKNWRSPIIDRWSLPVKNDSSLRTRLVPEGQS